MSMAKPQVIDNEEHERVAAIDVAKDTGMVCTMICHSTPGKGVIKRWRARTGEGGP